MRPTAAVRGDAPTGTSGRNERPLKLPTNTWASHRQSLCTFGGCNHLQESFPDAGFSRTSGGVLRRVPLGRKESHNTVRERLLRPSGHFPHEWDIFVAVSPFRQRAAKNMFRGYLFNGYRRLSSQVGYWIIPVVLGTFPRSTPGLSPVPIDSTLCSLRCRLLNICMGKEVRRIP